MHNAIEDLIWFRENSAPSLHILSALYKKHTDFTQVIVQF
jgi:hypothetical protein